MRLIDANALFNWGKYKLSDAMKYGNKDSDQQHFSYSTLMMYEIADEIEDAPTVEPNKGEIDALKENGFCGSCTGCNAPHDPDSITFCTDWEWKGTPK